MKPTRLYAILPPIGITFLLAVAMAIAPSGHPVRAQSMSKYVKVAWGERYEQPRSQVVTDVVGYNPNGFYVLTQKSNPFREGASKWRIYYYDEALRTAKSGNLDLRGGQLVHLAWFGDRLCLLYDIYDEACQTSRLFVEYIHPQSLRQSGKPRLLSEVAATRTRFDTESKYSVEFSQDRSKMLVAHFLPRKKDGEETIAFCVYDAQFQPHNQAQADLPFDGDVYYGIDRGIVANDGRVYLAHGAFDYEADTAALTAPLAFWLHGYAQGQPLGKALRMGMDDKIPFNLKMAEARNGDILCAGFYKPLGEQAMTGSCFMRVSAKSGAQVWHTFHPFGKELVSGTEQKKPAGKKRRRKQSTMFAHQLDDLITNQDGSVMMVSEQHYVSSSINTEGEGLNKNTQYFHYNDIALVRVAASGELLWERKIPKKQISASDNGYYGSYVKAIVGDNIYFLFNDNPENLMPGQAKPAMNFRHNRAIMSMVKVLPNGQFTKEAVFTSFSTDVLARAKVSKQISQNQVLLYGQRKKVRRFAKLTFK